MLSIYSFYPFAIPRFVSSLKRSSPFWLPVWQEREGMVALDDRPVMVSRD